MTIDNISPCDIFLGIILLAAAIGIVWAWLDMLVNGDFDEDRSES
jgi:hypothetical protein